MNANDYAAIYGLRLTEEQRREVEQQFRTLRAELLASGLSQHEVDLLAPMNDTGSLDWEPTQMNASD